MTELAIFGYDQGDPSRARSMSRFPAFTATQLKNETGTVLDSALRGPVVLTNHGRARAYIVPADRFERLLALEDAQLAERARRARARGMVGRDASMAFLKGLADAPREPVTRGKKIARAIPRQASAAARGKAPRARR